MTAGRLRLAAALLAVVSLAGCGDGNEETADRGATPAVAALTPAATPAMPPAPESAPPAMAATPPVIKAPIAPAAEPAVPPAPDAAPPAVAVVAPPPVEIVPPVAAAEAAPPAAEPAPAPPPAAVTPNFGDPALLARIAAADPDAGLLFSTRCRGCHNFGEGQGTLIGPNLYGIVGAAVGRTEGFAYSPTLRALGTEGALWTYDRIEAFLTDPATAAPGTRMGFPGIPNEVDRANVIAYLRTLAAEPAPLPVAEGPAQPGVVNGLNPLMFDQLQAIRGRNTYDEYGCGNCHGPTLRGETGGAGVGPPLLGEAFAAKWLQGDVYRLYRYIRTNMPPDDRGGIEDNLYVAIVAFLAYENGRPARGVWLPTDRETLEAMGFH